MQFHHSYRPGYDGSQLHHSVHSNGISNSCVRHTTGPQHMVLQQHPAPLAPRFPFPNHYPPKPSHVYRNPAGMCLLYWWYSRLQSAVCSTSHPRIGINGNILNLHETSQTLWNHHAWIIDIMYFRFYLVHRDLSGNIPAQCPGRIPAFSDRKSVV